MRLTMVFVAARGIGDFVAVPERVVLRRKQVGFHLTQNRSLFPRFHLVKTKETLLCRWLPALTAVVLW